MQIGVHALARSGKAQGVVPDAAVKRILAPAPFNIVIPVGSGDLIGVGCANDAFHIRIALPKCGGKRYAAVLLAVADDVEPIPAVNGIDIIGNINNVVSFTAGNAIIDALHNKYIVSIPGINFISISDNLNYIIIIATFDFVIVSLNRNSIISGTTFNRILTTDYLKDIIADQISNTIA